MANLNRNPIFSGLMRGLSPKVRGLSPKVSTAVFLATVLCAATIHAARTEAYAKAAPLPDHVYVSAGEGVFGGAEWIGEAGETELGWKRDISLSNRVVRKISGHTMFLENPLPKHCPQFRKRFTLADKAIRSARVAVSGMGFYELWLNGRKADPRRFLAPGAVLNDVCFYDLYDVGSLLTVGENAVGLWLAPGYSDDFSRHGRIWAAPKRTILTLEVTYVDGTHQRVVTDGSWQSRPETSIRQASLYHGEVQDAALADEAWATVRGTDAGWTGVTVFPDGPRMTRFYAPPVRKSDPRKPVKITRRGTSSYVVDFGQNRAGFVSLSVRGARGHMITVRTAEMIAPDGGIDASSNRAARSTDVFMLAGTGRKETFEPHFTYHGFQYVEITGWPEEILRPEDITSWALHADVTDTSSFSCSDATLMKLHNAAYWSIISNTMGYPTDCCMRDERTACRMDTQTYEDTAFQCFDMRSFFGQWFSEGVSDRARNPDWDGETASLPFRLWRYYGERSTLERLWPQSRKMIDSMTEKHPDHIFTDGYGDWCAPNDGTWKGFHNDVAVVNTALYCSFLKALSETASDLGRVADAKSYAGRFDAAKAAFHARFYDAAKSAYGDGSQTTYILPFAFGLVPSECREAVKQSFLRRIREHDRGTMDVGIFGARYLGDVLCDLNESDLLVDMLTQTNYAGYGNIFAQGATSLWEQWTPKGIMHSHNHAMFAGGASWLYTHLAGIRPQRPGYAAVLVKPSFPKRLTFVDATRETPYGTVRVRWDRTGASTARIAVTVPEGVPAVLVLPQGVEMPLRAGLNEVKNVQL